MQKYNKLRHKIVSSLPYPLKNLLKYIYYSFQNELNFPTFFYKFAKHEKKGLKYDCFFFFNEFDLLEIRLNILDDYVDYFVIIEASTTFMGKPKEMNFANNKDRYKDFLHKIIYYEIPWSPISMKQIQKILEEPNISAEFKAVAARTLNTRNIPRDERDSHWIIEYFQKESALIALKDLNPDDIVFLSDLDEIWNPKIEIPPIDNRIFVFKQIPYIYFLNNRSNEFWHEWSGSIVTKFATLKKYGVGDIRAHNRLKRHVIRNGGWHFSFQGGVDAVREKLNAYPHLEYATSEIQLEVPKMIDELIHIKGSKIKFKKEEKHLPYYVIKHKEKYAKMLL